MIGNLKMDIFELFFLRDFYYFFENFFQFVIVNQDSVFFIFDGYDEVNFSQLGDVEDLIMGKMLRGVIVFVILRFGKGLRVYWFMDFRIEISGFINENIYEFVFKYFQDDRFKVESLIVQFELYFVVENIVRFLLIAMFICVMWEEMF